MLEVLEFAKDGAWITDSRSGFHMRSPRSCTERKKSRRERSAPATVERNICQKYRADRGHASRRRAGNVGMRANHWQVTSEGRNLSQTPKGKNRDAKEVHR